MSSTSYISKFLASLVSSRCSNNFDPQYPPVNSLNLPSFLLPHSECLLQSQLRNLSRSEIRSLQTLASVYLMIMRDNNKNYFHHYYPKPYATEYVPSSPSSTSQVNIGDDDASCADDNNDFFDEAALTSWETRAFEALVNANHLVFSETHFSNNNNNNNNNSNNLKSFLQEMTGTSSTSTKMLSSPSLKLLEILVEEVLCSSFSFGGLSEIVATENSNDNEDDDEEAAEEDNEMSSQHSAAISMTTQTQNAAATKKSNSAAPASTSAALLHKILPTRNTKLTEILNGGLRTGSLIEICSSSKISNNNVNNNNSSPYYYFDEVTGEKYKIETDHLHQQQNSKNNSDEGVAAMLAALNMIPNPTQFGKTAVLSLSSNATNLFLQTFLDFTATRAVDEEKELLSSDDIVFEEYVLPPTSVSATRQKSLLDHLPAIEAKIVNVRNSSSTSSVDSHPVAMLMLLDLDAAMKDAITAVSILNKNYMSSASTNNNYYSNNSNNKMLQSLMMQQQQTKNGSNTNNASSSLLDFYGDKLLGELKKMAVRLNISIVIVRLTDSSDLMLDASAVLANLSNALTFHHNNADDNNNRGNNTRSFVNGSNNGNVGSYHAVNCRIRAGLVASLGTDLEESDSTLTIEVCKSAWCAMSINTI